MQMECRKNSFDRRRWQGVNPSSNSQNHPPGGATMHSHQENMCIYIKIYIYVYIYIYVQTSNILLPTIAIEKTDR